MRSSLGLCGPVILLAAAASGCRGNDPSPSSATGSTVPTRTGSAMAGPTSSTVATASSDGSSPTAMPPEAEPLASELRAKLPEGSGDYALMLALGTLLERGTITFAQLETATISRQLPPHRLGDDYLLTPSPMPPPGVKFDPAMMPTDWQGTWGEVAMIYHLGKLTREQYDALHREAHPRCSK